METKKASKLMSLAAVVIAGTTFGFAYGICRLGAAKLADAING